MNKKITSRTVFTFSGVITLIIGLVLTGALNVAAHFENVAVPVPFFAIAEFILLVGVLLTLAGFWKILRYFDNNDTDNNNNNN
jgi:uncharacterized membrane protein HdeD (DUF308 family)